MQPSGLILYVKSVAASSDFYRQLLGAEPVEQRPMFAMFILANGSTLGLWAREDVEPAVTAAAGSVELCVTLPSDAEVDAAAQQWRAKAWPVLQAPVLKEFGYTATTADPDGHRIRVFRLPEA